MCLARSTKASVVDLKVSLDREFFVLSEHDGLGGHLLVTEF